MKPTIWYHITEKHPSSSGMYLAYKTYSMGDDYAGIDSFYYDLYTDKWFTHRGGPWENIQYWCDLDVEYFANLKPPRPILPAEQIAFDNMLKAIHNYEIISGLSR